MTRSLAAGALAGRFDAGANPLIAQAAQQATETAAEGEGRYRELNKALDREAMQRGFLPEVDPSYQHAPEAAIEAFKDRKFGIRIHWGLYCMISSDASWALAGANKQFWDIYNVFYQFFNPTSFDAGAWMDLFEQSGIRYFTFTTKHHDGFSMWPTGTTQESFRLTSQGFSRGAIENTEKVVQSYSIQDGPYKKDIVRSVVEAGRRKGMGVGLYYSHVDWHDPSFAWDPFNFYYDPHFTAESDPERWQRFIAQERQQVRELMSDYGRIDYLDFDIGWPQAAAKDLAEITMMVRKLQPEVIIRGRGIGAYGDYYTPERQIPGGPSQGFWKVIYPCGTAFSYRPNDQYKPAEWIVESLIGITAKGGNFEVGFGPMPSGEWPPETVERLKYAGAWLRVNGEAIYNTRPRKVFQEGKNIWFTSSKDGRFVYAINMGWPGEKFETQSVRAVPGSAIRMLGIDRDLMWRQDDETLKITIPSSLAEHKPCLQAYAFKIQAEAE